MGPALGPGPMGGFQFPGHTLSLLSASSFHCSPAALTALDSLFSCTLWNFSLFTLFCTAIWVAGFSLGPTAFSAAPGSCSFCSASLPAWDAYALSTHTSHTTSLFVRFYFSLSFTPALHHSAYTVRFSLLDSAVYSSLFWVYSHVSLSFYTTILLHFHWNLFLMEPPFFSFFLLYMGLLL